MCEFCAKTEVTVEKLADEEESSCEWISEESGPGACDEPAVFAVSEWYSPSCGTKEAREKTRTVRRYGKDSGAQADALKPLHAAWCRDLLRAMLFNFFNRKRESHE